MNHVKNSSTGTLVFKDLYIHLIHLRSSLSGETLYSMLDIRESQAIEFFLCPGFQYSQLKRFYNLHLMVTVLLNSIDKYGD